MKIWIDGEIREMTEEEIAELEQIDSDIPTISDDSGGVKLPSWKKIRTIVVPNSEAIGQTIDGVNYNGASDYGVKYISFKTDEDGNSLIGKGITAVHVYFKAILGKTNINQGFLAFNNVSVLYVTGPRPVSNTDYVFEQCIDGSSYFPNSSSGMIVYDHNRMNVGKEIQKISFFGHENTSVLGEGATLEFYAYGYWDEESEVAE